METAFSSESIIAKKAYAFALEIIGVYKHLITEKKEYILSKQLLRCGTSIGANVNEALSSHSKKEFVYKLNIALKEAKESQYWLNLLKDAEYISVELFASIHKKCTEILKILTSIIITTKEKYFSNSKKDSKL